jgi:hypothetical protein
MRSEPFTSIHGPATSYHHVPSWGVRTRPSAAPREMHLIAVRLLQRATYHCKGYEAKNAPMSHYGLGVQRLAHQRVLQLL